MMTESLPPPNLPRYIPSLNGLRAVSIVLVFLAHIADTRGAPDFFSHFMHFGNLGVKVFFVISGFLITSLLLKEQADTGRVSLKAFYLRRTLRIFPAFYIYIAIMLILMALNIVQASWADVLHAVSYTSNYHVDTFVKTDHPLWSWEFNHLWSLSVEEQFYLVWPGLFVLLGPRRALVIAGVMLVVCPVCRYFMWYQMEAIPTAMTRRFQAVADALATGCLLAGGFNWLGQNRWYARYSSMRLAIIVPIFGLLASQGTDVIGRGVYYVIGQTIANVSIALIIDHYVRFPNSIGGRLLNWKPIVFIGTLSYSLYLWQEPFLNSMNEVSDRTAFPQNVVFAILAALASYYLIERPFLRLKDKSTSAKVGRTPPG